MSVCVLVKDYSEKNHSFPKTFQENDQPLFLCQYSIKCHSELFSLLLKSEGRGNLEKQGSLAQSTSMLQKACVFQFLLS
jgi:hypothetical protein